MENTIRVLKCSNGEIDVFLNVSNIATIYRDPQYLYFYKLNDNVTTEQKDEIQDVVNQLNDNKFVFDYEIFAAADKWVFEQNDKWSNNNDECGDNFGSFKAGVEWYRNRLKNGREETSSDGDYTEFSEGE
jgi:hypothetical protein